MPLGFELNIDIWTYPYICPKTKKIVTISQLGDIDFLPDNNNPESDTGAIFLAKKSDYLINKILVPTRWKFSPNQSDIWWNCYYTRWNSNYPYEGPYYDGLTSQSLFGTYTSFPDIDVIEAQENANHYVYFSTEESDEYDHNWFSNDRLYKGTKYNRWNLINRNDGGTAPDSFVSYLFTDGPGSDSKNGISTHDDIFTNWNL